MSEFTTIIVEYQLKPEQVERVKYLAAEDAKLFDREAATVEEFFQLIMRCGAWHNIDQRLDTWEQVAENTRPAKVHRFKKPTYDEVATYCRDRNNSVDPQSFLDFYTSNGWRVGKNPMKDWKAAVRTWEKREAYTTASSAAHTPSSQPRNSKHYNTAAPAVGERERRAVEEISKFREGAPC